jgi:hypothetical protein
MFRRGFKTWAEQTSERIRLKSRLARTAPLDPLKLADQLGVLVLGPVDLSALDPKVMQRLLNDHAESWSAITVSDGPRHLVIVNSSHAPARVNSSLAHELAHIILGHDPAMMFMSPASGTSLRTYNEEQEEEANWLAGALLIPRDALLSIRRCGLSDDEACREYGVSPAMLRYRFNVTGVDVQIRRGRGSRR